MHVLVMPFVEDCDTQSEAEMREFSRQLFEAIALLHSANILHGDVKRSNLRWNGRELRLIDFDLALDLSVLQGAVRGPFGTVGFRAPEVCSPSRPAVGLPADIWSCGVVILYELMRLQRGTTTCYCDFPCSLLTPSFFFLSQVTSSQACVFPKLRSALLCNP